MKTTVGRALIGLGLMVLAMGLATASAFAMQRVLAGRTATPEPTEEPGPEGEEVPA